MRDSHSSRFLRRGGPCEQSLLILSWGRVEGTLASLNLVGEDLHISEPVGDLLKQRVGQVEADFGICLELREASVEVGDILLAGSVVANESGNRHVGDEVEQLDGQRIICAFRDRELLTYKHQG